METRSAENFESTVLWMKNDDIVSTIQVHDVTMRNIEDNIDRTTVLFTDVFACLTGINSVAIDTGGTRTQY